METAKSLFSDAAYENLDFISQATEPFLDPLQEILAKMPESIPVIASNVISNQGYSSIYSSSLIRELVVDQIRSLQDIADVSNAYGMDPIIESYELKVNKDEFSLSIVGSEFLDKDLVISVVKKRQQIPEKEIRQWAIKSHVSQYLYHHAEIVKGNAEQTRRMKALAEILEADSHSRSNHQLYTDIRSSLEKNLNSDKWRVRSSEALKTLSHWIVRYINAEDYQAYASVARFKVLVHKNQPIYSLAEVE